MMHHARVSERGRFDATRKVMMTEPLITISKEIMSGTPVFYGTRVPVQALVDYWAGDETLETFFSDFPTVSREQAERFLNEGMALLIAAAEG
jgi:uncharacterized protein (DUF433 family)